MSKKQVMKEILSEKINQNEIYQNVLLKAKEEENMNKGRNKKIIYGITSSVALFVLCIGIFINDKKPIDNRVELGKTDDSHIENVDKEKIDAEQKDNIIFNTESIKSEASISGKVEDVDGDWKDANIEERFSFLKNIDILKRYEHLRQGMVYVKENVEDKDYSKLYQYQLIYYMDGNNAPTTEIMFTKEDRILQCMLPDENDFPSSTINSHEVKLFKAENFFDNSKINAEAFFEYDGYKFYIESNKITENDFIDIIKAIIKDS